MFIVRSEIPTVCSYWIIHAGSSAIPPETLLNMYQSTRCRTTEEGRTIAKKMFIYCKYDYTVAQLLALQLPC
jgi:hypothetical protein